MAQVATRDQHGLADSSINYTALAYQTEPLTAVSALCCNMTE